MLAWSLGLAALAAIVMLVQYNRMVGLRNRCKESWSDVDTELRRRHDLIPSLVASVKGYAAHEDTVFTAVTQARANAGQAKARPALQAEDENQLVGAVNRVSAAAQHPRGAAGGLGSCRDEVAWP